LHVCGGFKRGKKAFGQENLEPARAKKKKGEFEPQIASSPYVPSYRIQINEKSQHVSVRRSLAGKWPSESKRKGLKISGTDTNLGIYAVQTISGQ